MLAEGYDPLSAAIVRRVPAEFPTIEAAVSSLPKGPIHATILVERGTQLGHALCTLPNGVAPDRPFAIVAARGPGPRPTIIPVQGTLAVAGTGVAENIIVRGLRFADPTRDLDDPANEGRWDRPYTIMRPRGSPPTPTPVPEHCPGWGLAPRGAGLRNVLVEYCEWQWCVAGFQGGVMSADPRSIENVTVRRNIFRESWRYAITAAGTRNFAHSVYIARFPMLLTENILYHGGWAERDGAVMLQADGQRTGDDKNHNLYLDGGGLNGLPTRLVNNVIIDASSIGLKLMADSVYGTVGLEAIDNLVIGGEIGIGFSGEWAKRLAAPDGTKPLGHIGARMLRNVVVRPGDAAGSDGRPPSGRDIAWAFTFGDCDVEAADNLAFGPVGTPQKNQLVIRFDNPVSGPILRTLYADFASQHDSLVRYSGTTAQVTGPVEAIPCHSAGPDAYALLPGGTKAAYVAALLAMDEGTWRPELMPEAVNPRYHAAARGESVPAPLPDVTLEEPDMIGYTVKTPTLVGWSLRKADGSTVPVDAAGHVILPAGQDVDLALIPVFTGVPAILPTPEEPATEPK